MLNGKKHLRLVAEDLIVISKKELNEFTKNDEGTDIIKLKLSVSIQYFSTSHNFV